MTLTSPPSRVMLTQELMRVSRLRRRVWTPEEGEVFAERMTALLKTPYGQMRLRPVQAISLYELATVGGLFGPQTVGSGKTLCSVLAPVVLQRTCKTGFRPLLIVPASLVEKTERDRRSLAEHWQLAEFLKVMSYEWLGRAQAAEALQEFHPDLVILDEVHKAAHKRSAVTRRLMRFFRENRQVKCAALSGTITKRSLHDYAHILHWCLPAAEQPLPLHFSDLEEWADALDERKGQTKRADPGELRILCNDEERELWKTNTRQAARRAFRRRLVETPGVVATLESSVDASLTIRAVKPQVSSAIDEAFRVLRTEWETPDGWPMADGLEMFRHARELAAGFFYVWAPRPPKEWLEPRRVWCKFVRETLRHSRKFDSELQVRRWAATLPECDQLTDWLTVRDTFEPNTVPVWLDDSVLRFVADWAATHKGIVWVEHTCVGERLEKDFGLSYYGREGRDAKGRFIYEHPVGTSLVASIASNSEGKNLQAWSENLIVGMPPNGQRSEQLLGRTHREGQEADEVTVDVVMSCYEHLEAFEQARRDAAYVEASTGSPQKLLLAAIDMVPESILGAGPRWNK